METDGARRDAAAALAAARESAARMAADFRLPTHFYSSIGAAITIQVATSALGITIQEGWTAALFLGGLGLFLAVALIQLARFRRLNGVWVWALAEKVVLGGGTAASVTYCLAFSAALLAAYAEVWWLVPVAAVAGGVAYTVSGRRWMRAYRDDPAALSRGGSFNLIVVACVLATAGLVFLVVYR